ncbi:MAG TPA: hypothetical protein DCS30_14020 [Rhizobiales bacterium]|nr:hypothetical protein [Hyphomicrobiales bacterium]
MKIFFFFLIFTHLFLPLNASFASGYAVSDGKRITQYRKDYVLCLFRQVGLQVKANKKLEYSSYQAKKKCDRQRGLYRKSIMAVANVKKQKYRHATARLTLKEAEKIIFSDVDKALKIASRKIKR